MTSDVDKSPAPRVSVLVATFRPVVDLLRTALRSALAQTFTKFEILLSVDGDAAGVDALLGEFNDRRLSLLHNTTRPGAWSNHRFALRAARGRYVGILNHDDLWEPDFLQRLVPVLDDNPDLVLAFCDHWVVDERGDRLVELTDRNTKRWGRAALKGGEQRDLVSLCVRQSVPMAAGAIFRRDALDETAISEQAGPAYDLWLTYALARTGRPVHYEPARLTSWRTHRQGHTSTGSPDWALGTALCWEDMAGDPRFGAYRSVAQTRAAEAFCAAAVHNLKSRRRLEARAHARRSLSHRLRPRAASTWLATWLPAMILSRALACRPSPFRCL